MGKYANLYNDIYSGVFGTAQWIAEGIQTIPVNFTGSIFGDYIRVTVLADGAKNVNITKSAQGQVMIEIYTSAGEGTKPATLIADTLDEYLVGKVFALSNSSTTQFFDSSLSSLGNDPGNPSLYRMLYSIPFNHFGVQ